MTFEQLKDLACKHFKVTKSQIEGKGRKINVVYARIAVAKVLHESYGVKAFAVQALCFERAYQPFLFP